MALASKTDTKGVNRANIVRDALFAILIFWGLTYILVPSNGTPAITFVMTYFAALVGLGYALFQLHRTEPISVTLLLFAGIVFTSRVLIGVGHYLVIFDSKYFDQAAPEFRYFWDYEWLLYLMSSISQHWSIYGFGTFPDEFNIFEQKNMLLFPYLSLLFFLQENEHFLNVSILNSFHNVLVATVLAGFAASFSNRKVTESAFIIALMQPFGIFTSIMWRDSVGQFFLILGGVIIFQNKNGINDILKKVIAVLMVMSLRNIYFLVGLFSIGAGYLVSANESSKRSVIGPFVGVVAALFVSYFFANDMAISFYSFGETDFVYSQKNTSILKSLSIGFIGPFPWTQMLDSSIIGREYMLAEISQSMFNLTILYFFGLSLKNGNIKWKEQPHFTIILFVFSIMSLGLLGYGHSSYVTVASVLLLPLITSLNVISFGRVFVSLIGVNFILGIIWSS